VTESDVDGGVPLASLVSEVAADVTRLVRQEVSLARTEIRTEAAKAVRGARSVAIAAVALHMVAILASAGGVLALAKVLASRVPVLADWATAIAAGAVAVPWLLIGLILMGSGRRRLRRLSPIPRQTIQSLREDVAWLRKLRA
jgi:Putative Actinobacterial Holin-X, holin superfamily III